MPITYPAARMGYIGSVTVFGRTIRALSSSLNATQRIDHPDVVDGRIDWTLYQLGPIEVEGDVAVPVIKSGESQAFLNEMWQWATFRDQTSGELVNNGDVILNYSYDIGRTFNGCRVNRLTLRATAGDRVEATMNFMGTTVVEGANPGDPIDFSPARVLTWDDVQIVAEQFNSCIVREFSVDINNNCSRNYTFCPETGLFANNISTGKRNINGTLQFQGFAPTSPLATTNVGRVTSDEQLSFDFDGFGQTFNHIIYEYQDIAIDVGIITSTVNWYAHGGTSDAAID
jgi:hypothetical protein